MSSEKVLYNAFELYGSGSTFVLDYGGKIYFGGSDRYEGWYDTLTKEQTFKLYESLKVLFDGQ